MPQLKSVLAVLSLLLAVGCQAPAPEATEEPSSAESKAEIAWFEGTVEEAFATAAAEDKPLFLYWGAVWCPPCHYLKDKIFKEPEFVEQSRRFVAVYLDGDTARAQAWGEKLEISGYPTVLVLNPAGEEVMRMSTGIPVEEYNGVLDAALAQMRPIDQVLNEVLSNGVENAERSALELLGNYSWGQDQTLDLSTEERFEVFEQLYQGTPAEWRVVKSHFLANLLDDAARLDGDEERTEPVFSEEEAAAHEAAVVELLEDPELRNANPFFVAFSASDTIDLLEPEAGEEREALTETWLAAAKAIEEDDSMSMADRLYAINARLDVAESRALAAGAAEDEPLPEAELDYLRSRVTWANESITDESQLQVAMNVMANLLDGVGLGDEAKTMIEARLEETKSPYYYMSWLSGLEEDAGNGEAALAWSKRAWDESEGPYTRFQWGSGYVRDLLRLAPDDLETVEASSTKVLEELLANEDAFANRNEARLGRLDRAYREWSEGQAPRGEVEARIRGMVGSTCERFAGEGENSPRRRCESFADPTREADTAS